MKASEALRKGMGMVKGQAIGVFYNPNNDCACAIGCIAIGRGVKKENIKLSFIDNFAFSAYSINLTYRQVYKIGIDEDNDNGMTFEQIAQRLEDIGE